MRQGKILLLDSDPASCLSNTLRGILESSAGLNIQIQHDSMGGCKPAFFSENLSKIISGFHPDIIILALSHSLRNQARTLLQIIRKDFTKMPILLVLEEYEPGTIFELLKHGATDFITPPLRSIDTLPRICRFLERNTIREKQHETIKEQSTELQQFVGENPMFVEEIRKIPIVAQCETNVFIYGETGTGKELCARAIHNLSLRFGKPFITVNCGTITVDLIENELFGYEPDAFTSASSSQSGLIWEAKGGTLFLDEIDALSPHAQGKLLRFLQEKEYRSFGHTKIYTADVRIIAATNITTLEEALKTGRLRQDLYYRLNIISLRLPPLRERREDIPLLSRHFLLKYADLYSKQAAEFSPDALQHLLLFDWPGNIRELEHVIERAVLLSDQKVIRKADIVFPCSETFLDQESFHDAKARIISQFESTYIQNLLRAYQGNITKAAQAAKKNRRAFWQLIRKHQINPKIYRNETV